MTAGQLRKILEEGRCQPNHGCNVATTCMCALAEDAIEALEAALAAPAPADDKSWLAKAEALVATRPRSPEQAVGEVERLMDGELETEIARLRGEVERLREALHDLLMAVGYDRKDLLDEAADKARAALTASPEPENDDPCHGPQDTTCPSCGLGAEPGAGDVERLLERNRELAQTNDRLRTLIAQKDATLRPFGEAADEVELHDPQAVKDDRILLYASDGGGTFTILSIRHLLKARAALR